MKRMILVESAEELVRFCNPHRSTEDTKPHISKDVKLIVNKEGIFLDDPKGKFVLGDNIYLDAVVSALAASCYLKIEIRDGCLGVVEYEILSKDGEK